MTTAPTQRRPWEIKMPWKAWEEYKDTPLWGPESVKLSGSLGLYELADENYNVIYTGFAGSRARFGFRGKLKDHFSDREPNPEIRGKAKYFRYEVTSAYTSRWYEVLGRRNQLGKIPPANQHAKEYPRERSMPYFGPGTPP